MTFKTLKQHQTFSLVKVSKRLQIACGTRCKQFTKKHQLKQTFQQIDLEFFGINYRYKLSFCHSEIL